MDQTHSASAIRTPIGLRPEHKWISDGSTLNPAPGQLLKRRRDTAQGCRDRAGANLLQAVTLASLSDRKALEENAANWTARAVLLRQLEVEADPASSATPSPADWLVPISAPARRLS